MRRRVSITLALAVTLVAVPAGIALAEHAGPPGWITDSATGCQVWSGHPEANATVTWSGDCSGGKASGIGTLEWLTEGKFTGRHYFGPMRDGKSHGRGVLTGADGAKLEGTWVEGKPEGPTIFTDKDGRRSYQLWRDGKIVEKRPLD